MSDRWGSGAEWGYNGRDGVCKITFSDYIPFNYNPPIKIVISGDYTSITAKYLTEFNEDITDTIPQNGGLHLYSSVPDFAKSLNSVTTSDLYPASQKLVFKPGTDRTITYFMYDSERNIKSNYLDVPIPIIGNVFVRNAMIYYIGTSGSVSYGYPNTLTDDIGMAWELYNGVAGFNADLYIVDIFNNRLTNPLYLIKIQFIARTIIQRPNGELWKGGAHNNSSGDFFIGDFPTTFADVTGTGNSLGVRGKLIKYSLEMYTNTENINRTFVVIDNNKFIDGMRGFPPPPIPPSTYVGPSLNLGVTYVAELPP
jgi:hypothetical protein